MHSWDVDKLVFEMSVSALKVLSFNTQSEFHLFFILTPGLCSRRVMTWIYSSSRNAFCLENCRIALDFVCGGKNAYFYSVKVDLDLLTGISKS